MPRLSKFFSAPFVKYGRLGCARCPPVLLYHFYFPLKQTKPVGRPSVPAIFQNLFLLEVKMVLERKTMVVRGKPWPSGCPAARELLLYGHAKKEEI
jgi:hypothetical protein